MLALDTADAISFAFGLFNLLRLVSYIPQIAAVARDHQGAPCHLVDVLDSVDLVRTQRLRSILGSSSQTSRLHP